MADEVKTRITVEADEALRNLEKMARAEEAHGDSVEEAGKAASRATQDAKTYDAEIKKLGGTLKEVATAEDRYRRELDQGGKETDESRRKSEQRKRQIEQLTREVAQAQDAEERLNRELRESIKAHRQAGEAADDSSSSMSLMGDVAGTLKDAIGTLLPALSVGGGLAFYMQQVAENTRAANEELQRNIDLTNDATKATLDLQALSLHFNPEDEKFVAEQQEISGRSRQEIAPVFTRFKNATGRFLDEQQQRDFFTEMVVVPGLTTGGSLDAFADLASRAAPYVQDPVELRNLQALAIKAAGEGDPAVFAKTAADLLPTAIGSGINAPDTLALQSVASGIYSASEAGTKLEQLIVRFQNDPEVAKLLTAQGITDGQDFFDKLDTLRKAGTSREDLTKIANTENVGLLQALLARPDEIASTRQELSTYDDGIDLYTDFLNDLYTRSPRARSVARSAQQRQETDNTNTDPRAALTDDVYAALDNIFNDLTRSGDLLPSHREKRLARYKDLVALGQDPIDAIRFIEAPGHTVPGHGTIFGNTALSIGSEALTGVQAEVIRRLSLGVRGPGDTFYGSVPGADALPPIPIHDFGGRGEAVLNAPQGEQSEDEYNALLERSQRLRPGLQRIYTPQPAATEPPTDPALPAKTDGASSLSEPAQQVSSFDGGVRDDTTHGLLRKLINTLQSMPFDATQQAVAGPQNHYHGPINNYGFDPISDFEDHLSGHSAFYDPKA